MAQRHCELESLGGRRVVDLDACSKGVGMPKSTPIAPLSTLKLDGKLVAQVRHDRLRAKVSELTKKYGRAPGLAVLIVGQDPASQVYVRNKVRACGEVGIRSLHIELNANVSETELLGEIARYNSDPSVDGILVQLPLPKFMSKQRVLNSILSEKDPDGLTTENLGLLWTGHKLVAPCTPAGVMAMLDHYGINVEGKDAVVIGRSEIVGKPMAQLLSDANATVTVCHSKTKNLRDYTRRAEVVVVAAGKPEFLGRDDFQKGSIVIDVGIHRVAIEGAAEESTSKTRICGDVRWHELDGHCSAVSPVPGGVGPMTIQMLLENTVELFVRHQKAQPK